MIKEKLIFHKKIKKKIYKRLKDFFEHKNNYMFLFDYFIYILNI